MVDSGLGFGAFGGGARRTVQRMPVNPLDKCTIVSVYPKEIIEIKNTVFPGTFVIAAAPEDDISILVVGSSSWYKEMEENQPFLEIPNSSIQMAESIIKDWAIGLPGCNMGDAMPGLFFVPGAFIKEEIKKKFPAEIIAARAKQNGYWKELVKLADVMWARTNGNPLSVSDEARTGATKLGLKDKAWMSDLFSYEKIACKACGQLVNPNFPVCANCKTIINEARAKELGLKFAV